MKISLCGLTARSYPYAYVYVLNCRPIHNWLKSTFYPQLLIFERHQTTAMDILLLLAGSFICPAVDATNYFWNNEVFNVRQFQVTGAPSGLELCALSPPSYAQLVDSVLDCALNCEQYWYCENFNYKNSSKTCELFYNRPTCYGWTSGCTHYQVRYE